MKTMDMDRRKFVALGTAGAVAAIASGLGMGHSAFAAEEEATADAPEADEAAASATPAAGHVAVGDSDVNFTQEVDILIVGAGISGMMAAYDVAAAGQNVLIVDQNATYGGDAIYSAACQMVSTAKLTEEERPEKYSTPEQIREKFAPYYEGNEAGLNRTVLLQDWTGRWLDRMHYDWGYDFQPVRESPYHQAFFPKDGLCTMVSEFDVMNAKVEEAGAKYLFEHTFKTLILDEEGVVSGARFTDKNGNYVDIAAKGVVLATGGYVSNQEWMVRYAPEYADLGNIVSGRKGDGIAAGVAVGGTLSGMGPVSNLNPRYEAGHMLGTFYPLLGVLPNGKRFYCETAVHNAATGAIAAGYMEWYSIWDDVAQNGIDQEVIKHAGDAVQKAESIEELAEKMGMHIETVQNLFDEWHTICENQEDPEFGKTLFLQELQPPFYFLRNYPVRYKSLGGLTVSDRMEVLYEDGTPIPNLYACGCTAGTEDITPAAGSGMLLSQTLVEDYVTGGGTKTEAPAEAAAAAALVDGTYEGAGKGMGGDVTVKLTVADGAITVDEIAGPNETPGIGGLEAIEDGTFKAQIEAAQGANIDGITGATMTSNGVRSAVEAALAQAK